MNYTLKTLLVIAVTFIGFSQFTHAEIKVGDRLQTLTNLHPDLGKQRLYTMNYQLPGLIPVCSDVVVEKVKKKKLVFTWKDQKFTIEYDKHTKGAGVSFQDRVQTFIGPSCDKAAIDRLGSKDRAGIKSGEPAVGMTRKGIMFAMGPPPPHANPNLDTETWMYWRNRFARRAVDFDGRGVVTGIR